MEQYYQEKGFTFLEAMIAILILTTGIVIVLQIFPLALNVEKLSQMRTQAIELAQGKIEEITSKAYPDIAPDTEMENSLPFPFERFSRETKINYVDSDLATTTSDLGLKKIEVTVSWKSPLRTEEENVKLISLIAEK